MSAGVADVDVGVDNRIRMLRAAEQLFARHGIHGVSLREVNRAAGQRNASAVQYHFGDRAGLVAAVLAHHRRDTDPRRHAMLDECEASSTVDVRPLAAALVVPLSEKLDDRGAGRDYLQIACEFYTRAQSADDLGATRDPDASMPRWHRLVEAALPVQGRGLLPSRYPAVRLTLAELARRARDRRRRDHRIFVSHLTDLVAALLVTPPSAETAGLLADRERRR